MAGTSTSNNGSISSGANSSSSRAACEGYSKYTREEVGPYMLADLKNSERCDVDQLLAVFLERCRTANPSTPCIQQSAGNSQNDSPSSTTTEKPSQNSSGATTDPPIVDSNREDTVNHRTVSREFFQSILQAISKESQDSKFQEAIDEYQRSPKETSRYVPFVKLGNRGLEIVKSLQLAGLCEASTSDILFQVNSHKGISGRNGATSVPDIVIVPLASARRVYEKPNDKWTKFADEAWLQKQREQFEWPDVLVSGEMKWHRYTLEPPGVHDTASTDSAKWLPTHRDDDCFSTIISSISASGSNTTSNTSVSSLSTKSGSTQGSAPSTSNAKGANTEVSASPLGKRLIDLTDQGSSGGGKNSKKQKSNNNRNTRQDIIEAVEQIAISGAEMLCCSLGRRQAFSLIIIDAVLWIWWFDRQGAIHTTGINFLQDRPRFLLFLFCIQRFDFADWGFDVELDPSIPSRHFSTGPITPQPVELAFDGEDGQFTVDFTLDKSTIVHDVFSLKGKSTSVIESSSTLEKQPNVVVKLYWPNQDRPHEAHIIDHARSVPGVSNHLPRVFGFRDIGSACTRRIRDELGISSNSPRPPRSLRIIIFEPLFPITQRIGNDFIFSWVECMRCHYLLWEKNIRHLDLSLTNLMLRIENIDGKLTYFGVVNDWDLSDEKENRLESRKDLTKTMLFTALDLLKSRPPEAQVVQRYSHDLESFLWILFWVFLAVEQNTIKPIPEVVEWQSSNPKTSRHERESFLFDFSEYTPHQEWIPHWKMAKKIIRWWRLRIMYEQMSDEETSDEETSSGNGILDQNETPEERKELLRNLLAIVKKMYKGQMPDSPAIEGL